MNTAPASVALSRHLREVERQACCWCDFGETTPFCHISDPTKIQAGIVARDPRIRISEGSSEFDNSRHFGGDFTVMHRVLLSEDCDRSAVDASVRMNHVYITCLAMPLRGRRCGLRPFSDRRGGAEANAPTPAALVATAHLAGSANPTRSGWSSYGVHQSKSSAVMFRFSLEACLGWLASIVMRPFFFERSLKMLAAARSHST